MDKKNLTVTGKTGGIGTAEQASCRSKDKDSRRRLNVKTAQNVLLIWLDNKIDHNNDGCRNIMSKLKRVVNTINTFTDGDQCIEFINSIDNQKACMIISDILGQHILSRIHNMSQVDSIFIFCSNKNHYELWNKGWSKIKGIFTEIGPICDALKQAAQKCEQNSIAISFLATSDDMSHKNLNQLDCSFMYTQIMKEILLSIIFEQVHMQEFIDYCGDVFAKNRQELVNVKEFQQIYRQKTPIWWYTSQSFLYPMLNRALRVMDADIIIKMGFFIGDLHRHIEQLHSVQFNGISTIFTVYRGQGMSKVDFEQMTKMKGGLMSFNNFLSTSKDRDVSLAFAESNQSNPDLVGVLFIMLVDPTISTTPFACVIDVSCFETEDEILFSMHTVFRIDNIKPLDENDRLFQVELTLTSDNDPDLRILTNRIREETEESTGWHQLGVLLLKIGQLEKAQQVYEVMLQQSIYDDSEKADLFHQFGWVKYAQGEYGEAIIFYEKSLGIKHRTLPPNNPSVAKSYNAIGLVYDNMGNYSKALSYYKKSLTIREQSLPPNRSDLAKSYNNMGNAYEHMGDYSEALLYYRKTLEIRKYLLPSNHPDLASSYNNIGIVYYNIGESSKALSCYEKSLAIKQQSLPPNHPCLAEACSNIGIVYMVMDDYSKALSYFEKALVIFQQTRPPNHPGWTKFYNNISTVYCNMGDSSKALYYYKKAVAICQQSLPPNHPDLAESHKNIGNMYYNMREYLKALSYYEKSLAIKQQSLSPNHPSLAESCNNIGNVYYNMDNYLKAQSFYERAVDIGQHSLSPNHPNLERWRNNLEDLKKKL